MLALDTPIVNQTLPNNTAIAIKFPYFDRQFAYDEPLAIARAGQTLLTDAPTRQAFGPANTQMFAQFRSLEAAVDACLDVLERGTS